MSLPGDLYTVPPPHIAPPPPGHEWTLPADSPYRGMLFNPDIPQSMTWILNGAEYARVECCGCSYRFMPHGDVIIVPCKKHKKRMLAIGGHCEAKRK